MSFKPGDIVVPPGREPNPFIRFIVLEWKPGWIHLCRATRKNERHRSAIAFTSSDGNWVLEKRVGQSEKGQGEA